MRIRVIAGGLDLCGPPFHFRLRKTILRFYTKEKMGEGLIEQGN